MKGIAVTNLFYDKIFAAKIIANIKTVKITTVFPTLVKISLSPSCIIILFPSLMI